VNNFLLLQKPRAPGLNLQTSLGESIFLVRHNLPCIISTRIQSFLINPFLHKKEKGPISHTQINAEVTRQRTLISPHAPPLALAPIVVASSHAFSTTFSYPPIEDHTSRPGRGSSDRKKHTVHNRVNRTRIKEFRRGEPVSLENGTSHKRRVRMSELYTNQSGECWWEWGTKVDLQYRR
jgi:hypothetical protein